VSDAARILVVDDVPENVRLLAAVLEPQGYEVVVATDGRVALELAVSAKPDLVLLDVMMPAPDGYTVCRRLREHDETAVLPVIMLTASEGTERTKGIEAGADDFISKPFNRHELLTRIRSLLRIKRYHDTIKAQAAELLELNRTLEERVQTQLVELDARRPEKLFDRLSGAGVARVTGRARKSPARWAPGLARSALQGHVDQLRDTERRVEELDTRLAEQAREDEVCQWLTTIPGIGPIPATALTATNGHASGRSSAAATSHQNAWLR